MIKRYLSANDRAFEVYFTGNTVEKMLEIAPISDKSELPNMGYEQWTEESMRAAKKAYEFVMGY